MYTNLDKIAHQLLMTDYFDGNISNRIGIEFFIYHKDSFPYSKYYDNAKNIIRKEKLIKIKSKI